MVGNFLIVALTYAECFKNELYDMEIIRVILKKNYSTGFIHHKTSTYSFKKKPTRLIIIGISTAIIIKY